MKGKQLDIPSISIGLSFLLFCRLHSFEWPPVGRRLFKNTSLFKNSGGGKRTRFLNRLFPWRSGQRSSSGSRMMSHHKESPGQLFSGSSTSSVRRTSPVDLNLGAESSMGLPLLAGPSSLLVIPSSLPIPRFPDVVEAEPSTISPSHLRRTQRHKEGGTTGFRMTSATVEPSTYRPPTPEKIDREEMSALRNLASELNAALRLSEEENLLLKGNIL